MIWGEKTSYFWRDGPLKNFSLRPSCRCRRRKLPWQRREDVWLSDHSDWMNDLEGCFFFKGLQSWHEGFWFFLDFRWNEASEIKATSDRLVTSDVKAEILYGFVGYNARLTQFTGVHSGGSAKRHEPHLTIAWYLTGRFSCPSNQTEISPKPIWGRNKKTWFARMHSSLVEFFVPSLKKPNPL